MTEAQAIDSIVEQIFETFDTDGSGSLDKEQTKNFLTRMSENMDSGPINDDDFE